VRVGPWGIAAGVAAGIATTVVTSDRMINGGVETGVLVPATLGGASVGLLALGAASRSGWRWAGSPVLAGMSHATGAVAVGALGGAIGLGVALLTDRIWPAADGADPSDATRRQLEHEADTVNATAARDEAKVKEADAAASAHLDKELGELDAALEPNGDRMGTSGTVGEGRLDVTGLSPEDAAAKVLEAYAPGHAYLRPETAIRVDGANVFTLPWAKQSAQYKQDLTQHFATEVDTQAPKGVISADEARRGQASATGEVRSSGDADAGGAK
jgi:hypothetical protein